MPSDHPFQYTPRAHLIPGLPPEAIQYLEDRDRQLEDYLRNLPVASGGGVSTYCHQYDDFDLPTGSAYTGDAVATVTMPRNVGNKVLLNWTFELTFVGTSPNTHNIEISPMIDGVEWDDNMWRESDSNSNSIVFSAILSGHYLVEIPAGAGDFVVGIKIRNSGYANCHAYKVFITGMDVGTGGDTADCLEYFPDF